MNGKKKKARILDYWDCRQCGNHCATAASYPLHLLVFYLINVTHVVVSLYIVRRMQPKGEEETKAEADPNANATCRVP